MNEMTSLAMLLTHGYVVMISLSLKLARSVNDPDVEGLRTLSCKIMSYEYAINDRDIKELSLYDFVLLLSMNFIFNFIGTEGQRRTE